MIGVADKERMMEVIKCRYASKTESHKWRNTKTGSDKAAVIMALLLGPDK